jgi:hypothetical protein
VIRVTPALRAGACVLDEHDADVLLRILYNGTRPLRVHTLICFCGNLADLRVSEAAWNGWQLLPHAECPACRAGNQVSVIEDGYPERARERFLALIDQLSRGRR